MKKYRHEDYLAHTLPFVGHGVTTGFFVGVTVFFFKLIAEKLEELSHHIYESAKEAPIMIAPIRPS